MFNLIKNELIKIFSNRKIYIFLIILFLTQFLPVFVTGFLGNSGMDGQTYPLFMKGLITAWLIPVYLIILVTELVAQEYYSGTISLFLIHPITRTKLLNIKIITLLLMLIFLLLYSMLLGFVIGAIFFGWGSEFLIRGTYYTLSEGILLTLLSYLLSSLPILAFSILVMFISLLSYSSGVVSSVAMGLIFLMFFSGALIIEVQPYLISTYFNFSNVLLFSRELLSIKTATVITLIVAAPSYLASVIVFNRKDLV